MKPLIIASTIAFMLSGCGRAPETTAINGLTHDHITIHQADSIYKLAKDFPGDTQMAFALIQNGQVVYYGTKRTGNTLLTTENEDKAFEIGSITKVFTSTLLANFVVNKELALDSPINRYFDFPFKDHQPFTFRELANHTSGLPRLPSNLLFAAIFSRPNPYKHYDEKKLDEYLKDDISLEYPKGSKSAYSNLGVGLLSYAMRKYSGMPYEQLVKDKIFDRYHMVQSTTERRKIADILVEGLDDNGRPTPNWELGALIGAGGIYSTVKDLSKFALAQFDSTHAELVLTRKKTFQENQFRDVALGWFIINRKNGDKWYWHNGGTGGYSTSMVIDVHKKNGVIVLSNVSAYHKQSGNIDKLCFALMKTL